MSSSKDMLERAAMVREKAAQKFAGLKFDYEYPSVDGHRLDLRPGSEISTRIIRMVEQGIAEAKPLNERMDPAWRQMEHTLRGYMPADEWDQKVKDRDPRRPVNVVVPQTFSLREMFRTYMFYKFLRGGTIHRFRALGTRADEIVKAANQERIVAKIGAWFNEGLAMDMAFADNFTYGIGVVALDWTRKTVRQSRRRLGAVEAAILSEMHGMDVREGERWRDPDPRTVEEGTRLRLLDVRQCFFDHNVSCNDIQESECFGYMYQTDAMKLLRREQDPEEYLFNARYVRELARGGGAQSVWWSREDGRGDYYGSQYQDYYAGNEETSRAHVAVWFQEIIPQEVFGAGSDAPEKWVFGVVGDSVVVHAEPLDLDHGMWPVAVCAANANGHETIPISHLMAQSGLQRYADMVLNTKINLDATSVNGMIAWDESKVEGEDLMNPGPGKRIRIRNSAYGEGGIDRYILQLRTEYQTSHYIPDVFNIDRIARDGLGLNNAVLGRMESMPDRPTASGIQSAQQIGFSRLDLLASVMYDQFIKPIGKMHIHNNVQFLDMEIAVEVAGRYDQVLREIYALDPSQHSYLVGPDAIDAAMDVEPYNRAMSITKNLDGMNEFMKVVMAQPEALAALLQEYRINSIFQVWLEGMGFENAAEFKNMQGPMPSMIPTVLPDDMVRQQVQAGNLVGMGNVA